MKKEQQEKTQNTSINSWFCTILFKYVSIAHIQTISLFAMAIIIPFHFIITAEIDSLYSRGRC